MMIPVLIFISAYLVGSIPTSVWVGKAFYGLDIRKHGSGNAGATNMIRVLGWKAGVPVMIFDVFKGWAAVYLGNLLGGSFIDPQYIEYYKLALATAAVIGHVFPLYAGFHGGKGVATLLGVGIALYPVSVWIVVAVFLVIVISFGYVSIASIVAAFLFPFIDYFLFHQTHIPLIVLSVGIAIFVPLTHRRNIRRLLRGEEKKFSPGRKRSE